MYVFFLQGKGEMKTYFLLRRTQDEPYQPPLSPKYVSTLSMTSGNTKYNNALVSKYTPVNCEYFSSSQVI